MTSRFAYGLNALRSQLALSPVLTGLGVLGVVAGALCMAGALIRGVAVPPEGNLIETATFNGSVGVFVLTLAVLLPGVEWTRKGRRVWTGLMVVMILYSYGIETVQAFRGLDPRFSSVAGPVDQALGGVFLLAALIIMGLFTVLAVKYFRAPSTPVVVAVRYGAAACFIAFSIGILMSAISTRQVGEAGNLRVLHAAGFHGIQAVPFVALLLHWARADRSIQRTACSSCRSDLAGRLPCHRVAIWNRRLRRTGLSGHRTQSALFADVRHDSRARRSRVDVQQRIRCVHRQRDGVAGLLGLRCPAHLRLGTPGLFRCLHAVVHGPYNCHSLLPTPTPRVLPRSDLVPLRSASHRLRLRQRAYHRRGARSGWQRRETGGGLQSPRGCRPGRRPSRRGALGDRGPDHGLHPEGT